MINVSIEGLERVEGSVVAKLKQAAIDIVRDRIDEPTIVELIKLDAGSVVGRKEMLTVVQLLRMMYGTQRFHAQYCYECDDWKVGHAHILDSPCEDHNRITVSCTKVITPNDVVHFLRNALAKYKRHHDERGFEIFLADTVDTDTRAVAIIGIPWADSEELMYKEVDYLRHYSSDFLTFELVEPVNCLVLVSINQKGVQS